MRITKHTRGLSSARGFTLVEMLIVGALIALFSGLAVFSVTTQFNINRQKASVAECRHIATALSFAHQDMGFFPKLCWLRHNVYSLKSLLVVYGGSGGYVNSLETHNLPVAVGVNAGRLDSIWKGAYGSFSQDRVLTMFLRDESGNVITQSDGRGEDWPGDPFGNPYVAYFVHAEKPSVSAATPIYRFIQSPGEDPSYYAGVVSYGRNKVPGLGELPSDADLNMRKPLRLYKEHTSGNPREFQSLTNAEYRENNDEKAQMIRVDLPPAERIREVGSDDRYYEF